MPGEMSSPLHHVRNGTRGRPVVVLLHGFLGSHADWQAVISVLDPDFDVLAVDLPGHGDSVGEMDAAAFTLPGAACAVMQCLDAGGIESALVIGYSMGGRLALYMALHAPERCRAVIMESASPGLMDEKQAAARILADENWARRFESEPLAEVLQAWYKQPVFSTLTEQADLYEKMIQQRLRNRGVAVARSLRGMSVGAQTPLWDRLPELQRDVWVLTGQRDAKYCRVAAAMAERSRRIRAVPVPDAGHNAHLERPVAFNRQVLDILKTYQLGQEDKV